MAKKKKTPRRAAAERGQPGQSAKRGSRGLRSYAVGALPIVNRLLERIQLENNQGSDPVSCSQYTKMA